MPCVVADTSPLFYLARLGKLSLLHGLYRAIAVPERVWEETLAGGRRYPGILPSLHAAASGGWLSVHAVPELPRLPQLARLDAGERDAILLARQLSAECLLIDDLRGRDSAQALGLTLKGTLAILAEAKTAGLISSLASVYHHLRVETTFRFSRALENELLLAAGEAPSSDQPERDDA